MVSVRKNHQLQSYSTQQWMEDLPFASDAERETFCKQFQTLTEMVDELELDKAMLEHGREMVSILFTLNMDLDTLLTAILVPFYNANIIDDEYIQAHYSDDIALLLTHLQKMEAISTLHSQDGTPSPAQIDNLRRMLLTMVEDVRIVVIKLAERICYLREIKNADEDTRVLAARETANIYAPLANRLGIGQLKWELEDYAFRYLHPDTYMGIAKLLDEKRLDRQRFIDDFVGQLNASLIKEGIHANVYGRPKHIYSIWKKMQRKQLPFEQLFDVRAVRVIVPRIQDCYGALGVIHTNWRHIPREFDDYVATPKPNGYQSIHTVVLGAEGRTIEIQIRTQTMHDDAELGVAAHWKYKEGALTGKGSGYEGKIAWLRKILAWQDDVAESGNLVEELRNQVVEDRVYVFTPRGDVVDLPTGATPLDFAYYVHSQVGHRCTGAKIDGRIVPFTYQLQTGDQVEILTQKHPNPSRDWLNPNLGYIRSSRARSKVMHWFKLQDREKNLQAGKDILEHELSKLGLPTAPPDSVLKRYNYSHVDDLYVAVGAGDVKQNQVINHIQSLHLKEDEEALTKRLMKRSTAPKPGKDAIVVDGVGNLLTNIAKCCQPVPGDAIMGYITQGKGISVHRADCEQGQNLMRQHPEREVEVRWGENYSGGYAVSLKVLANDRSGLLRDVSTILANEKINVMSVSSHSNQAEQLATMNMDIEIYNLDALARVVTRIEQLPDVLEVRRL